jgi:hypothetical protein
MRTMSADREGHPKDQFIRNGVAIVTVGAKLMTQTDNSRLTRVSRVQSLANCVGDSRRCDKGASVKCEGDEQRRRP